MYDDQPYLVEPQSSFAGDRSLNRAAKNSMRRVRKKHMETPRELRALISYLRQQEAGLQEVIRQLRDAA